MRIYLTCSEQDLLGQVCYMTLGKKTSQQNVKLIQVLYETYLSLWPSVVEKVVDSWYWYDNDTDLFDLNLGTGDPMALVADANIRIQSFEHWLE